MPDNITRVEERRSWRQAWLWGLSSALALAVLILIAASLYNYLVPNPGGQDEMAAKYDLRQQPIGAVAPATHAPISVGTLYWHFVDAVWLAVFLTFYVTPYLGLGHG